VSELKERARDFQVMGVVREPGEPTVLTEAKSGAVTLTASTDDAVEGRVDLEVRGLRGGETRTLHVAGSFEAPDGLPGYFRHPIGRLLEQ